MPRLTKAQLRAAKEKAAQMTPEDLERLVESEAEPLPVPRSSWEAVDLTAILDGTAEPILPTVGHRTDGVGLFYPGRTHWVAAESESGKTWFALHACRQEIDRGNSVVYVDFEDDAAGVVGRLLVLGANPADVAARFLYVRPERKPTDIDAAAFVEQLRHARPTLAVIDGVTEAMSVFGLDPLKLDDIPAFTQRLIRPMVQAGAAVVALDHVVKASDNRGRYAIGSAHKLNGLNGAMYVLEVKTPISIGMTGRTRVRISKDRPAQLRRHALPGRSGSLAWFADLVVESHDERHATVRLYPPAEHKEEDARTGKLQGLQGAVLKALQNAPEPLSGRAVHAVVGGNTAACRSVLAALVDAGMVETIPGPKRSTLHRLVPEALI
ncbi:AAA family ATPase [Streptomyces sp. NPDC101225]|uniref:AAA family ATPase n=1 Tax=Streptomyces sp. NPDC101225 TaxID=3366135 RepID=UPI00380D922C